MIFLNWNSGEILRIDFLLNYCNSDSVAHYIFRGLFREVQYLPFRSILLFVAFCTFYALSSAVYQCLLAEFGEMRQVEAKELLARRQTEAALLCRKINLMYFRQSLASKSFLAIFLGISAMQIYCKSCSES